MVVHSSLPDALTAVVDEGLRAAGVEHVAHASEHPVAAAEVAASDSRAVALIGPYRSADVAEAVEVTAPAVLPLLAPVATSAGVTRSDEPGCEDPAQHDGTVLRLIARDTEVAARIAADVRNAGQRALVVAGRHSYGRQLAGQLDLVGLPRTDLAGDADLMVLCCLAGDPEIDRALALAPLPIIAFDGVQGSKLAAATDLRLALPVAPDGELSQADLMAGLGLAKRAAELVVAGLQHGARDRASLLANLRMLGPFDAHGDPIDAPVWLWHSRADWLLTPDRPLPPEESAGGSPISLVLEASDSPVSVELQRAYFADITRRYPGWSPDLIPSADPAEVVPPAGAWVVAYLGGQAVGCGGIKRLDDEAVELKRIYLAPSARGHGLGRRLLEALEKHARALGYSRVRLDTGDRQPEALGLFRSAGYVDIPDYNGNTWATYWMEKRLEE